MFNVDPYNSSRKEKMTVNLFSNDQDHEDKSKEQEDGKGHGWHGSGSVRGRRRVGGGGSNGEQVDHAGGHVIGDVTMGQPGAGVVSNDVDGRGGGGEELGDVGAVAGLDDGDTMPVRGVDAIEGAGGEDVPADVVEEVHVEVAGIAVHVAVDGGALVRAGLLEGGVEAELGQLVEPVRGLGLAEDGVERHELAVHALGREVGGGLWLPCGGDDDGTDEASIDLVDGEGGARIVGPGDGGRVGGARACRSGDVPGV